MRPRRRPDRLVVKEVEGELLVYDLERHVAHCLNPAAACVFKRCDGQTTVEEMARLLRVELQVPADEKWVLLALERLGAAHLLEPPVDGPSIRTRYSRRELVREVGRVGVALLPIVASLTAPTPAEAAATCVSDCSGQSDGTPCGLFCAFSCTGGVCT